MILRAISYFDKCFDLRINQPLLGSFYCRQIVAEAKVSIFTILLSFPLRTLRFMMIVCLSDCYSRPEGLAKITLANIVYSTNIFFCQIIDYERLIKSLFAVSQ